MLPTLARLLLLTVVCRLIRRGGQITNQQKDHNSVWDDKPKQDGSRRFRRLRFAIPLIGSLVCIGVTTNMYFEFRTFMTREPPSARNGTLRLAFDDPATEASMRVTSRPNYELDVFIEIDNPTRKVVPFTIKLSGDARVTTTFPDGSPYLKASNGCWGSVSVIPDTGVKCRTASASTEGFSENETEPAQIITGNIYLNDLGFQFTQIALYSFQNDLLDRTSGKWLYKQFPSIGKTYVPPSDEPISLDYGISTKVYSPKTLSLVVDGGDLSPTDRLETVSPSTLESGRLAWGNVDATNMSPYATVVNIAKEAHQQDKLFLFGVFAGLLPPAGMALLFSAWREAAAFRHRRR